MNEKKKKKKKKKNIFKGEKERRIRHHGFRVGGKDDGRIVTHAAETNHKVLRDSFAVSRSNEDEQRIPTSTRIEHEDVGGGDSQDKLGRDANGDEDGRTSVHDERMRESVG